MTRRFTDRFTLEGWPGTGPDLAFLLACVIAGAARAAVLANPYAPSGVDAGNWLAFGNDILGHSVRSASIVYPPLVPLLVRGATAVMGTTAGIDVVAALASLAPALGCYAVLRACRLGWAAVPIAALMLTSASVGEPAAWGGYPQLIGLGFLVVFLWRLDRFLITLVPRDAVIAGAALAAELATSHLIATLTVVCGALVLLGRIVVDFDRLRRRAAALVRGLALVPLPSLPLVPIYVGLVRNVLPSFGDRPEAARLAGATGDLVRAVDSLFTDVPLLWRGIVLLALITPVFLANRRRTSLWLISTALTAACLVLIAGFREYRFVYLVPIAAVMALGCWFDELRDRLAGTSVRRMWGAAVGVLAVIIIVQLPSSYDRFRVQRRFYEYVTPQAVVALEWLRDETPTDDVVAVPAIRGTPYGWWVEGLGERRTLSGSRLQWLNFEDERRRARMANALFSSTSFPNQGTLERARGFGADILFVVKTWPGFKPAQLTKLRREVPDVVLYENRDVVLIKVGDT